MVKGLVVVVEGMVEVVEDMVDGVWEFLILLSSFPLHLYVFGFFHLISL